MKNKMKALGLLAVLVLLAGCSAHEITPNDIAANGDTQRAISECWETQGEVEKHRAMMMQSVPEGDRMMVAMLYLQSKSTAETVAAATGNTLNPCAQRNIFDAQIAEVRAKNKALESGMGVASTAIKWGAGVWGISEIMDGVGSSLTAGGDIISKSADSGNLSHSIKTNNDIKGDNNLISDDPVMGTDQDEIDYGNGSSNDNNSLGDSAEESTEESSEEYTDNSEETTDNSSSEETTDNTKVNSDNDVKVKVKVKDTLNQ